MARIDFALHDLTSPSGNVAAAVAKLVSNDRDEPEHRAYPRHAVTLAVPAVAVDGNFRPVGDPFVAITGNISQGGISLIHSQPISAELVALELPIPQEDPVQVVVRILRSRQMGPFHEVAGPFVSKLEGGAR